MNPEVSRLLLYMATFSTAKHRLKVARAMDLIANSPTAHALIAAGRRAATDERVVYPVAILAAEAVEFIEGRRGLPDWLKHIGFAAGAGKGELVPAK